LPPREEKVEAADPSVDVDEFPDNVESGDVAELHGGDVEVVEGDAAAGDFRLGEPLVRVDREGVGDQVLDERCAVGFLQRADVGVRVDVGLFEEECGEGGGEDGGEDGAH